MVCPMSMTDSAGETVTEAVRGGAGAVMDIGFCACVTGIVAVTTT